MKLRIRPAGGGSSSTLKVEVPAACSLQGLQDAIIEALESRGIPFSRPLRVSLNKTEPIEGQGSALLSHFGIRNGDLLFYFETGGPRSATAGVLPSGNAGNLLSVASAGVDTVSKDVASTRRELCAAAAARRASSVVHSFVIAVDVEDTKVSVSDDSPSMVHQPGSSLDVTHTSMYMQIDGENLPHDIATRAAYTGEVPSSVLHSSVIAVDVEDKKVGVSEDSPRMVDQPGSSLDVAHTSMDMQIDGENLPHDTPTPATDAGGARVSNSIPAILQRILIAEHRHVSRPSDLLVLAVHAVMLETGFIVMNAMEEGHTLPGGWSNGGSANICYTLPEIRDAENGVGNVVLKSLTLGGNVLVFGTISPVTLSTLKLSMQTSKHIIGNVLSHDDLISSYSDLFELWKCAKDALALPLLTTLCNMAGLPAPSSLLVIPTELKMKILECLPVLDLVKAGCTCSELRHLSENDELWKRLFHEDFGNPSAPQQLPSFRGWKAAYAVRFLERKRMLERRPRPQRPLYGISSRFPPRFPRMGGIIGGDYDIFPSFGTGPFRGGFGGPRGPFGGLHGRFRDEDLGDSWYT